MNKQFMLIVCQCADCMCDLF